VISFRGVLGDEFKYHLVSWSNVCSSTSEGGLGIQDANVQSNSLKEMVMALCT
jgi:hypothetical protein